MKSPATIAKLIRNYYAAYESKDRKVIENLLAEDFTFSSPLDDHIDKVAYLRRCWPNSKKIRAFRIQKLFSDRNEAFVLYELESTAGARFRNTEFFRFKGNKIMEVEVYFGSRVGTVGAEE